MKLDFGLSSASLDEQTKKLWGYAFNLIYSVTLSSGSLTTSLLVTNDDDKPFDLQVLLHTYFRVEVCSFPGLFRAGGWRWLLSHRREGRNRVNVLTTGVGYLLR